MYQFKKITIMRTLILTSLSIILISCSSLAIKPTTKVVKEDRNLSGFSQIQTYSSIDVYIKQGDKESVVVETNEEYQKQVLVSVEGKKLLIKTKGNIFNPDKFNVYITVKELTDIRSAGSGDIESVGTLKFPKMNFKITGSGDLEMDLITKTVSLDIEGSGDAELQGKITYLDMHLFGSGDIEANTMEYDSVLLSMSGSGDVKLLGSSRLFNIDNSGSGDIDCATFKVKETNINSTGSGDITLNVEDILNLNLAGSGDFKLLGNPATKNIKVVGSGNFY